MIFSRTPVSEALAAVFKGRGAARSRQVSGGHGEGETPLPIPNRAVKPLSADGTWPERARESRSPPVFYIRVARPGGPFFYGSRVRIVSGSNGHLTLEDPRVGGSAPALDQALGVIRLLADE